jgi:hypothetical protein
MTLLSAISLIGYSLQFLKLMADEKSSAMQLGYYYWIDDSFFHPFHGINITLAVIEIALALWAAAISYLASRADIYSRQAEKSGRCGEELSPTHC